MNATEAAPRSLDVRGMTVLSIVHVVDDSNQSALPALLPFLIAAHGLSYTAAAGLMLFASLSSSVVQPAIGALADRRSMPWLIALGVFFAAFGIALVGVMPNYWLITACVALSGVGIAAFHPEAARFANYVAGDRKATGMRWFAAGGNLGFAAGPLLLTPLVLGFGPAGTLALAIPGAAAAALVMIELPRLRGFVPVRVSRSAAAGTDRWGPFALLTAAVSVRSMAYIGLVAFTPLYLIGVVHASTAQANVGLTLLLASGAAGTIFGGRFADRAGRKTTFVASTLLAAPAILAFVSITTFVPNLFAAYAFAMLVGFVLVASQTAYVVMGQEYLPNRLGVASGVTLGLAISLGGAGTPVLGLIADHISLAAAFEAIAALAFAAGCIAAFLPQTASDLALSAARGKRVALTPRT
ncbi:MAG: MFS transporter [Candidatus Eremiobacteraeota bacterium]|nr:MFS transporter [Candidatus Eremiobacteraeota bacterium]